MFLTWHFEDVSKSPLTLLMLSIFCTAFLCGVVCLIILLIYRLIIKNITISLDILEALQKNPLRSLLLKLAILAQQKSVIEEKIRIWRTKYELLYEKEFLKSALDLTDFLTDRKFRQPTIKNLIKSKEVYLKLMNISQKVYEIQQEIKNEIEIELIMRDTVIDFSRIFIDIRKEVDLLDINAFNLDKTKLQETLDKMDALFENFYDNLESGDYKTAWSNISELSTAIAFLIQLLDNVPYIINEIQNFIPDKLNKFKNRFVITNKTDKAASNLVKFSALEKKIDEYRTKADSLLRKLQFKKSYRLVREIYQLINIFQQDLENVDKLQKFFNNNEVLIKGYIDENVRTINNFERRFKIITPLNKQQPKEYYVFQDFKQKFEKSKLEIESIYAEIDTSTIEHKIDYLKLKDRMISALNDLVSSVEGFEITENFIETQKKSGEDLSGDIIFVKSIIMQAQVKVNQYLSVKELNEYEISIQVILKKLDQYSTKYLEQLADSEYNLVKEEIKNLTQDAWNISNSITDKIFADYMAQEIMNYMERYTKKIPEVEAWVQQMEESFRDRNLDFVINFGIAKLRELKKWNNMR
ncbi:hypothetical protein [Spiroplasma endosymbiont of Labia minor]|uniref:hypothetical protein n=1 Tax=Spiroplasma endosymbiont of Labia minor TaxID=3066305 RepID=UPI0030CCECD5